MEVNEEVLYTLDSITKINKGDLEFLKAKAASNHRKRIRLCVHPDVEDGLHEMLIIHTKGNYVRPHKHTNKSESFHIIEGELKVIIFDEKGTVLEILKMGSFRTEKTFFFRISENHYHTIIITSDCAVIHETTNGPFKKEETIFAPWAPEEDDYDSQGKFFNKLATIDERIDDL